MAKNPFPGINPYLNSYLLINGGWKTFHSKHITHLTDYLESILPSNYYTMPEDSLQITAYHPDVEQRVLTGADISVYATNASQSSSPALAKLSTPTLDIPVISTIFNEDELYTAIVVYDEGREPVTRIELLSPSNKPTYKHYDQYIAKRDDTLRSGLRLVEIDYLHNTRPIIPDIPSYKDRQDHGHPYMILVSDPRPTLEKGRTFVYGFGVMDTLPIIDIPLKGNDVVRVTFGDVYNTTFESSRAFSQIFSDANKTPPNLQAYAASDQQAFIQHTKNDD